MSTATLQHPGWSVDLDAAPAEGPVAFGGDLTPRTLLAAYRQGLFPFPATSPEHQMINELTYESAVTDGSVALVGSGSDPYALAWCSPDPRPIVTAGHLRIQRSLRQQLRNKTDWHTTVNRCFARVVDECRAGRAEQWLTDDLLDALIQLHLSGYAHSVEVWDGDDLVGGVYGVRVGTVFSADSQFTRLSGAGKVAVLDLARRFADAGGRVIDVQRASNLARLLGAEHVARTEYLPMLACPCGDQECRCVGELDTDRAPARRLADCTCHSGGRDGSGSCT